MSNLQAAVRAFATETTTAGELCQQVNRILCGNIAEGRFISFFYCTVDTAHGTLTYANAGHYPPILVHADGSTERLSSGGPVLGPFADASYDERQISIVSGDRLVLFTDGITEVRPAGVQPDDPAHVEFGEDALLAGAVEHRACTAPVLQERLTAAVSAYAGGTFQDDATLMILAVE
jgi:sigma-B regulation protein RsbU (phosphoserine phosphatase)